MTGIKKGNSRGEGIKVLQDNLDVIPCGYISSQEASEKLKMNEETILRWCRQGKFSKCKKLKIKGIKRWIIPEKEINEVISYKENIEIDYFTVTQFAQDLECSPQTIRALVKKGELLGKSEGGLTYVKKGTKKVLKLMELKECISKGEFISRKDASTIFNLKNHIIISYEKYLGEEDIFNYLTLTYIRKASLEKIIKEMQPKKNFLTVGEAAEKLSVTGSTILKYCIEGKIENAYKSSTDARGIWYIPNSYVENEIVKRINEKSKLKTYLTLKVFAEKMGVSPKVVRTHIKKGTITEFELINHQWFIKEDKVVRYEKNLDWLKRESNPPNKKEKNYYSKESMYQELKERIEAISILNLPKLKGFYLEYCKEKIGKTRSKGYRIKSMVTEFIKIYEQLISKIPEDINYNTEQHVHKILLETESAYHLQREFNAFLKYAYMKLGIQPKKQFTVKQVTKRKEEKIYSPEIYNDINVYARDIEKHINRSIRSAIYVNMWIYVLLHLTDVWRNADLIEKMPSLQTSILEKIQIYTHGWFKKNRLSLEQSQEVINYLYLKLKPEVTNKTRAHLTFLVEPSLVNALATAVIIAEIHRRRNNKAKLLYTLMTSYGEAIVPTKSHLEFFKDNPKLKIFRNLRMNHSTMTYFYYQNIESDADNSDVVIDLNQHIRSHKQKKSTEIYISLMNKDGSINRICENLFRRGHFGWLYNYMIITALGESNGIQTIEERTRTIEVLKEDVKPRELEEWAEFLEQNFRKRSSLIVRLSKLSKYDLSMLIGKIFRNEMPAKTFPGQCIKYPNCPYKSRTSCFGCEYFIPQLYVLNEASKEFQFIIKSMQETKFETIFRRDETFLRAILIIMAEAKSYYSPDQVNAFLSTKEIKRSIDSLKGKVFIK